MKSLQVLQHQLEDIQRFVDQRRNAPQSDATANTAQVLQQMSGNALQGGGVETVLRLISEARARGET